MSSGPIQCEAVLHPCWLHLSGSQPLPANPRPLLFGRDEGISLCSSAPGIYEATAASCVLHMEEFDV